MILWNAQTITENNHPGPNPLQGHSYLAQGFQKKVTGESAKNRVALVYTVQWGFKNNLYVVDPNLSCQGKLFCTGSLYWGKRRKGRS